MGKGNGGGASGSGGRGSSSKAGYSYDDRYGVWRKKESEPVLGMTSWDSGETWTPDASPKTVEIGVAYNEELGYIAFAVRGPWQEEGKWRKTEKEAFSDANRMSLLGDIKTSSAKGRERYRYKYVTLRSFIERNGKSMIAKYAGKDIYGNKFSAGDKIIYSPIGIVQNK
jgi:hypothetical protein